MRGGWKYTDNTGEEDNLSAGLLRGFVNNLTAAFPILSLTKQISFDIFVRH